ncbi:MAG: DUF4406 domain-containing protein [Selenomonadaceae bacterium]|nr:DUF4406 domain-containing protein [Selenomonadaceae bacterium]
MIYISHPFTGDEEKNRKKAREIAAGLAKRYPHETFINPLDAMQYAENAKLDYNIVISHCLKLLSFCDHIIMTGNWRESRGCQIEYAFAKICDIKVWEMEENHANDNRSNCDLLCYDHFVFSGETIS